MPKDTTTKQERILIALEYASLLYYEWHNTKKKIENNSYDFLYSFDELIQPEKKEISNPENLERNYRNYLSDLEESFDISVLIKKKLIQINSSSSLDEVALDVISFYIKNAFQSQNEINNDSVIKKYLNYRIHFYPPRNVEEFLMKHLYILVFIRYAIKYKLKMDFSYKKLMSNDESVRRLYPLHLTSDMQYLTLVANDNNDHLQKQFILANLHLKPNQSLIDEFKKNWKKNERFQYKKYKQSDEGRFQRQEIKYKIHITSNSLEHLLLNYDFPIKILEDHISYKIIELNTSDKIELHKALFGYDVYAKILSPKEEVQEYRKKLERILNN